MMARLKLIKPPMTMQEGGDVLEKRFSDVIGQQEAIAGLRERPVGAGGFSLGPETQIAPIQQQVQQQELFAPATQLAPLDTQATLAPTTDLTVTAPTPQTAAQTSAQQIATLPTAQAAVGQLSTQSLVDVAQAQGQVSANSLATAATQELDTRGTVQFQLGELYNSIETGQDLPAWAAGPVRTVSAIMQQRGLGGSSMASAAMIQALQESAMPIAVADANKFSTIQLQNLNNQQQSALANAAVFASMDRANLDARMTALVNNSRAFLAIDTQNLTNEQQTATLDFQTQTQKLFTETASQNAANNFNATSQNQVNQFYDTLGTTVEQNNINRVAAQNQFNVDETNAMKQFTTSINDLRDRTFETQQQAINQSNAVWRRTLNTANTAAINETQRINSQQLLGLSVDAQNRMWQQYRDEANFLMNVSENNAARGHAAAMLATQLNASISNYNTKVKDSFWAGLGEAVFNII
jgi:hypothetical protein